MNVKKIITILIAVGVLFTFAIVSTTPVMAASKKKAEETMKKAKKSTKKAAKTTKALPEEIININTATKEELMLLPGIGEKKAEKIINARKAMKNGKFSSVEEVMGNDSGVGEKTLEKIKPFIKLE